MSNSKLVGICRLCLCPDQASINVLDDNNGELFNKIDKCLPVSVLRDDMFPKNICSECYKNVNEIHRFWDITLFSESQMIKWLEDERIASESNSNVVLTSAPCAILNQMSDDGGVENDDNRYKSSQNGIDDSNSKMQDDDIIDLESDNETNEYIDSDVEFISIEHLPVKSIKRRTKRKRVVRAVGTSNNVKYKDNASSSLSYNDPKESEQFEFAEKDSNLGALSNIFKSLYRTDEIVEPPPMIMKTRRTTSKPKTDHLSSTSPSSSNTVVEPPEPIAAVTLNCHNSIVVESYDSMDWYHSSSSNNNNSYNSMMNQWPLLEQLPTTEQQSSESCFRCETCISVFSSWEILAMHKLSCQYDYYNSANSRDVAADVVLPVAADSILQCAVSQQEITFDSAAKLSDHAKCHTSSNTDTNTDNSNNTTKNQHDGRVQFYGEQQYDRSFAAAARCNPRSSSSMTHRDQKKLLTCVKKTVAKKLNANRKPKSKPTCFVCDKTFGSKRMLCTHLHTVCCKGIPPYRCHVCDKELLTKHSLECHKLIHAEADAFLCETCGKTFANRLFSNANQDNVSINNSVIADAIIE